jgi:hypothetical protein
VVIEAVLGLAQISPFNPAQQRTIQAAEYTAFREKPLQSFKDTHRAFAGLPPHPREGASFDFGDRGKKSGAPGQNRSNDLFVQETERSHMGIKHGEFDSRRRILEGEARKLLFDAYDSYRRAGPASAYRQVEY